jgi:hypothetical protein
MRRIGLIFLFQGFIFFQLEAQEAIDHWEMPVKAENTWKYRTGTSEPSADWINLNFDDSGWNEGQGGFGYGDDDDGTTISVVSSVYLRIKFSVSDLSQIGQAVLLADYDDAFVAYLNGVEVARAGISGSPPLFSQYADYENEAFLYQNQYPSEIIIDTDELSAVLQPGENILAVQVHNVNATSSDLTSNFYLVTGLTTGATIYQPVTSWFREPIPAESSNLPIIKIDTYGASIADEPKISAFMGIIDNGPGQRNNLNDPFNDYAGEIAIEIRGSSSQSFPKKQYAVELRTASGADTSATVLGLPKEEDWILYAPYSDKSLIRNVLTYKLGNDLGWYAPRTRLVELMINQQYMGVYVLTEKIKRDPARVDISNLNPDENSGDDLTGGYIVKIDKFDGATQGWGWDSPYAPPKKIRQDQVIHFQYHYPKEDEITTQQSQYIQNYVTAFENALAGPDWKHTKFGYRNFINVESFIDFAIINELSRNVDGYRLSTFLYKDKDSKDAKLYLGPLWDFNLAFGNADYCNGGSYTGWGWDFNNVCNEDYWLIPFWWKRLLMDPEYVLQFQDRWTMLRQDLLSNETVVNYIDSVATVLDEAQYRNFEKWPILDDYIWPNNYVGGTYANEVQYLKSWIGNRLNWLDSNIAALEVITGIHEPLSAYGNVTIYPNPSDGNFNIRFYTENNEDLLISIYNQLGQEVIDKRLISEGQESIDMIDMSELSRKGIYFLRISDRDQLIHSEKLIIY